MSGLLTPYFKQNTRDIDAQREAIEGVLKKGPSTVSAISEATGYAKDLVLWNLIGMMKWGTVEIESEEGEELTYKLKEV
ncbi:MAG: hypothetical protein ACP6KW_06205 [Candidatus Thorarchaeota archaeon]|nr:MAG: hypothetical protein DRO87_10530 [Candidatus Thorarchaeota archaeon]RLI55179.1 MAG: hypothetical protein DRP09_10735 [Candidatus Thorarchaeota archaeon]